MRVGFYLDQWRDGGVPVFLDRLERQLTAMGHEVLLFLAKPFPKREKVPEKLYRDLAQRWGARCIPLHLDSFPKKWREAHFCHALLSHRLDCLLINHFAKELFLMKQIAGEIPLVTVAHTDSDYYYHEFLSTLEHRAAHVAVSRALYRKCLLLTSPEQATGVHYIPYGVPQTAPFKPDPTGPFRVVYVARLDPLQKRCQDLIPIWQGYLRAGGQGELTIIGAGRGSAQLYAALRDGLPGGRVEMHDHLSSKETLTLIARGDVLLNVSNFEGLPQTVLEGASLGLYPLISDIESGHREIVETLQVGTLCHVGDIQAFVAELLRLEGKLPALRAQRTNIREKALQHYSLGECAGKYQQVFESARRTAPAAPARPGYRPSLREVVARALMLAKYRRHYPMAGWTSTANLAS